MQPRFNIERERKNSLFYKNYKNDFCLFQFHSQIELYFVDGGEMEMLVDGKQRVLGEGELSVALSYSPHAYKTPVASQSSVLLIPPHMCEEFVMATKSKKLADPFITDKRVVSEIRNYCEKIKEEKGCRIKQLGYIYTVLGIIMESSSFIDVDEPIDSDLASRILFYISENFKEGITPSSIASHFGYNQSYVSRYFKACFNITLCKYLTAVRLRNAVLLLNEGKHDITY